MAARTSCLRRCSTRSTTSPSQQGVEGTDSEEVWILTEESAILVMSTSLLGTICLLPYKGGIFYARSLQATSRCAIRGHPEASQRLSKEQKRRSFRKSASAASHETSGTGSPPLATAAA